MERWDIREGDDVYDIDGNKVGSVAAVRPGYVVVKRGRFRPTTYHVPAEAVAGYEEGSVRLAVSKETTLNANWESVPPGVADDAIAADARPEVVAQGRAEDRIVVPLHEEELTAATRPRQIGEVRLEKEIVSEERTVEVPVTEERLRVTRHRVDRPAPAGEATLEETVVEVPIRGEEVLLGKRVRVAEELEIGKETVRRTEQVSGTVRREEIRVTEDVRADEPRRGGG